VLLVDPNRVARTALARALVREQWEVTVVDSAEEIPSPDIEGGFFDAAIIDEQHPAVLAILELLARRPTVAVVVRSDEPSTTLGRFEQLGIGRRDVKSRNASADELVRAVRRVVGFARR
jgi:DNA-binding NarL/FixJ family response regulator